MSALLDINCLIALFDAAHVHHRRAHEWLIEHRTEGWATCPLTQNGCIRILSQPTYPSCLPVPEAARRLGRATVARDHTFWSDDVPLCDGRRFDLTRVYSPKLLTDVYLLALAVKHGGSLVTFDRGIPLAAVAGATTKHLVVL
jgi:toxin-antitoxin system PIN domain toxin